MTSNPYSNVDPWDVSTDTMLPVGNYVGKVIDAEAGTSRNGNPQIELKLEDAGKAGTIRDWIVITPQTMGKVVQLLTALGLPTPPPDDAVNPDGSLHQDYVDLFVGKSVGFIVRSEPDYQDPTKTRTRVKGYVLPSEIENEGTPSAHYDNGTPAPADEKLPF